MNGSLSGFGRFTLLLTDSGERSIFAANRPYCVYGVDAGLKTVG